MSEAQLGLCSPPHLGKDGTARPQGGWVGPIELVGGWLVRPSLGIWEAHPLLAVLLRVSGQFLENFPRDGGTTALTLPSCLYRAPGDPKVTR